MPPNCFRTRSPSKRAAADPRLRPRGHWDRRSWLMPRINIGFSPSTSGFSCQCHSTNAMKPSSSPLSSYQNDKRRKWRNCLKKQGSLGNRGTLVRKVLLLGFYIHGSVHRELNLITVQQDATVFSLLHFCRQLYTFRLLTPIIRSSSNCKYSFWYWLTGSTTIRSRCWVVTDSCVSYGRYSFVSLCQWWANYGPRARYGPLKCSIRPARHYS